MEGIMYKTIVFLVLGVFVGASIIPSINGDNTIDKDSFDLEDGLVGYWSFNEGTGTTVFDSSGNGNNGTIYGCNWVNGICDKCLHFDGVDDYVIIPDNDILDLNNDFSLEFWLKTYDNVGRLPVMSKHTTLVDNDYSWTTFIEGDSTFNFENTPGWHHLISDSIIEENKWTHIVVTFMDSSNDMRIYFNGVLDNQGSVDIDIRNNDKDFIIGTQPHHNSQDQGFYEGLIDEIRIYNRELNESEVMQLYSSVIGDMNGDGRFNAADVRYLAMYLNGDPSYSPLHSDGDVNSDGRVNAADVRYLAMYLNGNPAYSPLYP